MGSCDRCEGKVCAEEGESIPVVKRRKRRDKRVHSGAIEKGIHLAIKVTSNSASVLHREERWEEANGPGL